MLSISVGARSFLHNRNSDPRRQFPHSRRKIDVLVFHDKTEDASPDTAAKTVKRLALWTDMKRWRFFLMKGAECLEIRPGAFQRKVGANYFHDVVCGRDLLNCF